MNRLALVSVMVLAFGTALGATLISGASTNASEAQELVHTGSLPTPYQIAAWKATAVTTDYMPPAPPR
jgi:hypothetical protein